MKFSTVLLALVVAGCGGGGSTEQAVDAAPADDGARADSGVDAVGEPVSVIVRSGAAPVVGAAVYFQNVDGSLAGKELTDATGTATHAVETGGSVTAVDAFAQGNHDLHTWVGVKAGDQLVLAHPGATQETVSIAVPTTPTASVYEFHATGADPNFAGNFAFTAPPAQGHPTGSLAIYDGATTTDVLIVADLQNATNKYFYAPGKTLTGSGTSLDLTTGTYAAVELAHWVWTNLPADINDFTAEDYLTTSLGAIYQLTFGTEIAVDHSATKMLTRPALDNTTSIMSIDITSPTNLALSYLLDWAPRAATENYDAQGRRLRDLTTAMTFDPATHAFAWAEGATGATADLSFASVSVMRGATQWTWEVVAPHAATGATLPVLPTEIAQYNVTAADTAAIVRGLWVAMDGGYDALRPLILAGSIVTLGTSSASGRAAYQFYSPPH